MDTDLNSPASGPAVPTVAPASLNPTEGAVFCTAAINADGTSAQKPAGNHILSVTRLSTGNYEVLFRAPCGNVTAAAGFTRFVQVDTLTSGAITAGVSCTTADRSGAAMVFSSTVLITLAQMSTRHSSCLSLVNI